MASAISTKGLLDRVKEFVESEPGKTSTDPLLKYAIVAADRELRQACDDLQPLAWDIVPYDELRTRDGADITAITQADPGIITADSRDTDITGHGFSDNDIVVVDGIEGMEELNGRMFVVDSQSSTTLKLKTLDASDDINTTNYTAYSSGGSIWHAGFILNTTTILAGAASKWTFRKLLPSPTFDGYPAEPIDEAAVRSDKRLVSISEARRPDRWRYWLHQTASTTMAHYLFWYPPCDTKRNVSILYQKDVPDISTWDGTTYPFHPPEVHEYIWHGALAILHGISERMKRQTDQRVNSSMEVMFAREWVSKWEIDKRRVRALSREMLGQKNGVFRVRA